MKIKIRILNAFVGSIFLYNSELWTLNAALNNKIDVFHRNFLRKIANIRKKDKISNTTVYQQTNTTPWSEIIKKRRITWFGHLLRLSNETPAKQALQEFTRKTKRPQGKPKTTWLSQLKKDLSSVNIDPCDLEHVTNLANE